jgi:hypothetical protein
MHRCVEKLMTTQTTKVASCAAGWSAWHPAAALLLLGLASGCAIQQPGSLRQGMDEAQVVAAMGPPTGRYAMPERATRLEFARGPAGSTTWMVDLDAGGRMTSAEQVLDGWHFLEVTDGTDRETLLRTLGRPSDVRGQYQQREIWYWRYYNNDCLIAAATLDAQGRVVGGIGLIPDPRCEMRAR